MPTPEEIDELWLTDEEFDLLDSAFTVPADKNILAGYLVEPVIHFNEKQIEVRFFASDLKVTPQALLHISIPLLASILKVYYDKLEDPSFDGHVVSKA